MRKCTECQERAAVLQTRPTISRDGEWTVRRHYACKNGHRFSTLERLVDELGFDLRSDAERLHEVLTGTVERLERAMPKRKRVAEAA